VANAADQTVNLTPTKGMDLRSLTKQAGSPFLQNVLTRNGDFQARPGFGLVRAYDTTLNNGRTLLTIPPMDTFALDAPIGVQTIRTSWGSDQIVTVHPVRGYNGNLRTTSTFSTEAPLGGPRGYVMSSVAVVVHDLASDQHFEFVLHQQDVLDADLMRHFPHYATRFDLNSSGAVEHTRWLTTQRTPTWALIVPFESAVIIAIDGCGLWCYRPVDTPVLPDRKVNSLNITTSSLYALGEVAACSPLNLADGVLIAKEQNYLTPSEFGQPNAMGAYDNRMIYAVGNALYFSDLYQPNAILTDSIEVCPFLDPVTVVCNVRGTLFVASAKQSWVYQPAQGTVTLQGGSWTMLSGAAGCVNNRAFALADQGLFFVEDSGVYSYAGGVVLQHISEPVDRLWTDAASLQMVLTDYYTATGQTLLTDDQLPARIDVRAETPNARCHWNQERGMLFVTLNSATLVYTLGFGWSVWYFASHAGWNDEVFGIATIDHPHFASSGQRLFMVGGVDNVGYSDPEIGAGFAAQSCYLLELGRGGAIDRSTSIDPALRDAYTVTLSGYWTTGDTLRVTINGVNYDTVMSAANAAATDPLAAFAASVNAVVTANPEYFTNATLTGCTFLAQTAGLVAFTVSASVLVGSGTVATVHTRTGAAADNSEAQLEDQRTPIGGWVMFGTFPDTTTQPSVWVGQPVVVPAGYETRTGAALAYESLWFPVSIGHWENGGGAAPTTFSLRFLFNSTVWTPVLVGATAEFDFQMPSRRIAAIAGFAPGAPVAARQVAVYDPGTGALDPAGNEVRINFNGAAGIWTSAPQLNMSPVGPDELVWIGFRNDLDQDCWQLPIASSQVRVDGVASPFYAWQQGLYAAAYEDLANKQQPLDWAVKTLEVQSRGEQIRVRGVYLEVQHLGTGNNEVTQFWQYGPLNTATSSDMRDYSGQAVDFFTTPPGNSEQNDINPRKRLQTVTGTEPHLKTFNNIAKWASTADPSKGNLLIDDAQVDTVATTDGTQGNKASVLVHGTMNAPGDGVRLGSVEAVIRVVGGRRRWH
jgi:hypothetical protein